MSIEDIVIEIQKGNKEEIGTLWERVYKYVRQCAMDFHAGDLEEDLIQEGFLGVLEAVQGYDATRGYRFLTYAGYYIKTYMRRFLYKSMPGIRIPEGMALKIKKYNDLVASFMRDYGREPTDHEAKAILKIKDIEAVKTAAMDPTSLDKEIYDSDGAALKDVYARSQDNTESVIESVFMDELKRDLWHEVDKMPDKMREAIQGKYIDDMTYKELGEVFNCSIERVHQIVDKALKKLKNKKTLRDYYSEIYGRGLRGTNFRTTRTSSTEYAAYWLLEHEKHFDH